MRVLIANPLQVAVSGPVGFFANSTALVGVALDNMADAAAYVVNLYAVGRTIVAKSRAANCSGVLKIILSIALAGEVLRRFFSEGEPIGDAMIITAMINAVGNWFFCGCCGPTVKTV